MTRNGKDIAAQNCVNWTTISSVAMLLLVIVGAFWALAFGPIQDKFATLNQHVTALDTRRSELLTQVEFLQFEKRFTERIESITKQILLLEQSRPTTGELNAISANNEKQVNKLEERVRSLELFTRQPVKSN